MEKQLIEKKKKIANDIYYLMQNSGIEKWFYCFGTLLYLVRDKKFYLGSDIDIGVIGNINSLYNYAKNTTGVLHYTKSDTSGNILNFAFRNQDNVNIDIFRWVDFGGLYWHTYDWKMENNADGIPPEYIFKGVPHNVFICPIDKIKMYRDDMRYYDGHQMMSENGTWQMPIPEDNASGIILPAPYMYGWFLDIAYPNWFVENEQFGQSVCYKRKFKTCRGLC